MPFKIIYLVETSNSLYLLFDEHFLFLLKFFFMLKPSMCFWIQIFPPKVGSLSFPVLHKHLLDAHLLYLYLY